MTLSLWTLTYLALGAFTGFFAGMLGIGGGLVMVPTLTLIFAAQAQFPAGETLHMALGTSMATIIFTAVSSLRTHHQHGAVLWNVVKTITPGILFGTPTGTQFAASVPSRPLAIFFTFFVCLIAIQMAANLKPKASRELPGNLGIVATGLGIGALSSLVAIGGGSLTVPFLTWCSLAQQLPVATLKRIFAGILVLLAGKMLWNLFGN